MGKGTEELIEGEATRKLSQLIPIENIKLYLQIYHKIKNINIKDLPDYPYTELTSIIRRLRKLQKRSWLSEDDAISIISNYFLKHNPNKWLNYISKLGLKKIGSPRDTALDILIFSIIYDLKLYTEKPYYGLVADLLSEQGIIETSYHVLRRKYKKLNISYVNKILICYSLICDEFIKELFTKISISKIKPGYLTHFLLSIRKNLQK